MTLRDKLGFERRHDARELEKVQLIDVVVLSTVAWERNRCEDGSNVSGHSSPT